MFEDNIGESLSIDETCLSSGEVYTFLTNKAGKGRKGTLVAVVKGTKAEDVIQVLKKIDLSKRNTVKEITLDLSSSMMRIARSVFPKALITNDRFHVQKLYYDALDDILCLGPFNHSYQSPFSALSRLVGQKSINLATA